MAFIVFSWGCYGIQIGTFWIRSHANTYTRSGSLGDSGHGMGGWVACEADLDQTRCPFDLGWNWHKFNETLLISWYMLDQGVRRGRIVVHGDLLTILPLARYALEHMIEKIFTTFFLYQVLSRSSHLDQCLQRAIMSRSNALRQNCTSTLNPIRQSRSRQHEAIWRNRCHLSHLVDLRVRGLSSN
jgi:hypothetical protein